MKQMKIIAEKDAEIEKLKDDLSGVIDAYEMMKQEYKDRKSE